MSQHTNKHQGTGGHLTPLQDSRPALSTTLTRPKQRSSKQAVGISALLQASASKKAGRLVPLNNAPIPRIQLSDESDGDDSSPLPDFPEMRRAQFENKTISHEDRKEDQSGAAILRTFMTPIRGGQWDSSAQMKSDGVDPREPSPDSGTKCSLHLQVPSAEPEQAIQRTPALSPQQDSFRIERSPRTEMPSKLERAHSDESWVISDEDDQSTPVRDKKQRLFRELSSEDAEQRQERQASKSRVEAWLQKDQDKSTPTNHVVSTDGSSTDDESWGHQSSSGDDSNAGTSDNAAFCEVIENGRSEPTKDGDSYASWDRRSGKSAKQNSPSKDFEGTLIEASEEQDQPLAQDIEGSIAVEQQSSRLSSDTEPKELRCDSVDENTGIESDSSRDSIPLAPDAIQSTKDEENAPESDGSDDSIPCAPDAVQSSADTDALLSNVGNERSTGSDMLMDSTEGQILSSDGNNIQQAAAPKGRSAELRDDGQLVVSQLDAVGALFINKSRAGRHADVKNMLQADIEVNFTDESGYTAFLAACEQGHRKTAKSLLRAGANIDAQTVKGLSCLHLSFRNGHQELCQYLLDKGADAQLKDFQGQLYNQNSSNGVATSTVPKLKEQPKPVQQNLQTTSPAANMADNIDKPSPRMLGLMPDGTTIVDMQANRDSREDRKATAKSKDVSPALFRMGSMADNSANESDDEQEDSDVEQQRRLAVKRNAARKRFLQRDFADQSNSEVGGTEGASVQRSDHSQTASGRRNLPENHDEIRNRSYVADEVGTSSHHSKSQSTKQTPTTEPVSIESALEAARQSFIDAIASGNAEAALPFLEHGVSANAKDADGNSALCIATEIGSETCVRILLEHGADRNIAGADGLHPAEIARSHGFYHLLPLLEPADVAGSQRSADSEEESALNRNSGQTSNLAHVLAKQAGNNKMKDKLFNVFSKKKTRDIRVLERQVTNAQSMRSKADKAGLKGDVAIHELVRRAEGWTSHVNGLKSRLEAVNSFESAKSVQIDSESLLKKMALEQPALEHLKWPFSQLQILNQACEVYESLHAAKRLLKNVCGSGQMTELRHAVKKTTKAVSKAQTHKNIAELDSSGLAILKQGGCLGSVREKLKSAAIELAGLARAKYSSWNSLSAKKQKKNVEEVYDCVDKCLDVIERVEDVGGMLEVQTAGNRLRDAIANIEETFGDVLFG